MDSAPSPWNRNSNCNSLRLCYIHTHRMALFRRFPFHYRPPPRCSCSIHIYGALWHRKEGRKDKGCIMWKRSLLPLLLSLLLLQPIYSVENPDPEAMTDSEIYAELSMISERQLKRWEMLETELPQLQLKSEILGKDLETLSLSLSQTEKTLSDRTSLSENSIEEIGERSTDS